MASAAAVVSGSPSPSQLSLYSTPKRSPSRWANKDFGFQCPEVASASTPPSGYRKTPPPTQLQKESHKSKKSSPLPVPHSAPNGTSYPSSLSHNQQHAQAHSMPTPTQLRSRPLDEEEEEDGSEAGRPLVVEPEAQKATSNGHMNGHSGCTNGHSDDATVTTQEVTSVSANQNNKKAANSSNSRVGIDDFELLSVLGKGAYGRVYQVRQTRGPHKGRILALKSVRKSRIVDSQTDVRHTRTERDVLARVKHPFLIKMYYAFETRERLYFVQEFCRGGELFRLMETQRFLLEDEARFYLCQIACALDYLHQRDIIYRDLKTENIMIDADGHIKLIDFGLSKIFSDDDLDEDEERTTNTFCGTVEYMAPEVVLRQGHSAPADWWSFGVFMYDLLVGHSPFGSHRGKKETKERIVKGKFAFPKRITPQAQDLIRKLLRKMISRRLGTKNGADEVRAHCFFDGIDWERVLNRDYPPPHVPDLNRADETDLSQFDPQFTSRTPRESVCGAPSASKKGLDLDSLFPDFDYVCPELAAEELEELDGVPTKNLEDLHIRPSGE